MSNSRSPFALLFCDDIPQQQAGIITRATCKENKIYHFDAVVWIDHQAAKIRVGLTGTDQRDLHSKFETGHIQQHFRIGTLRGDAPASR